MSALDFKAEAERRLAEGNAREAALCYQQAGAYMEAAFAFRAAGDLAAALLSLTHLAPDQPRYRDACMLAVAIADELDRLSLALENFLARFLHTAPESNAEVEALDVLARLYERQGFPENAAEIFHKLSQQHPEYRDVAQRILSAWEPPQGDLADLPPLPNLDESAAAEARIDAVDASLTEEGPVFRPGVLIAGRYRLERRIGTGGMSVVFQAADVEIEDEIALKVLTQAVFDAETDARLRRELMLSRQLVHPNIVRIFEIGMAHGLRYLVMELLAGSKLSERLRDAPLPLAEGLDYLSQVCAGLQAAHNLGVIHRDVKPGNCFVTQGGALKVMDFGLAKMRGAPGLTASSIVAGTPAYMSPEQANDFRSVTSAADIYSLGVVAFEMFTARLPFVHENQLNILLMHRETPPPPPRSINPALPEELERIILRCLEKDPLRRYGSCRELGQHLVALRSR
jgi:serine/threonine-protein kinase